MNRLELPNGKLIACVSREEAEGIYREVVAGDSYFRHGITVEDGAVVVDVGANIGLFAMGLHWRLPNARIYSFEPVPPTFEALNDNASTHGDGKITPFNTALGRKREQVTFTFYRTMPAFSGRYADVQEDSDVNRKVVKNLSQIDPRVPEDGFDRHLREKGGLHPEEFQCQVVPLADIIREQALARIDLLKVDVEKAELDVVLGIEPEQWKRIRHVAAEVHDLDGRAERMKRDLEGHGFSVVLEQEPKFVGSGLYMLYARRV
jgi:FkbM family methyltransferase